MNLFSWLETTIEGLTPDHLKKDVHTRKRVRMFLISHIFGPFLGLPIPATLFLLDPDPFPQTHILAASIIGFWPFLLLIKLFPKHYTALALASIVNLNFAVLWASFNYGGASSPFLLWYILMPMLAFFYLGAGGIMRIAVFSQVVIGLGTFVTAYILSGAVFPENIPVENMAYAGMLSAFCATTYAFVMASYYASVVDSQSELMMEITRHETTLKELTVSKEDTELAKNLAEARNAELELAKASLEFNALHDALTGLPNRRYLDNVLAEHAATSAASEKSVALLHVDLDRFKQINDTLGHVAGDEMLKHVARLLRASVSADDFVARVGGDEFIVVSVADEDNLPGLSEKADLIIDKISQPVPYQGHLCRFGASVGIAVEHGDKVDPKDLLVNSDIALYRAKETTKGGKLFFSKEIQSEIVNAKEISDDILRGIEQEEFISFYQPQFDARTHELVGVEALVRWKHPVKGMLAPAAFLKIAEDLNAVSVMDRMILERAVDDLDRWSASGIVVPKVAVNVSARRLNDIQLIDSLRAMNIKPGTISFELVESIFLDETDDSSASNINEIRKLGIEIEIDDFGTGHASIVSLLNLNPSYLKIDRQFVTPVAGSPEKRRLVSSIVDMGKSLGIKVVAEGVETIEQAHILRELRCDVLQGYAFAKPMPVEELEKFIERQSWRQAS
jgi:diguanylate cyclase (GGDEF)-like protein